ncbi:MAG: enoyl-CoA hydratase/isomerase family protein [Dehalococcoidia bacterium]|nr:enoyl-CoA hydratase/isomerase family protein [Dehalococcoidia bacterium]
MEYKYLKYEVEDGILTITHNRPEKLNAQSAVTAMELNQAFIDADQDDDVRAIIVTGAGKAFSAGADLTADAGSGNYFMERFQGKEDIEPHRDEGGIVNLTLYDMKKPLIAAINGPAIGFGITMTLPMDIRLASKNAKMGFVFTRRGILFDGCASWFLPRIVGLDIAAEWVYSGRIFGAQEAFDKRLLTELLEPEDLMPRARQIAKEMIENSSSVSIALCRQLMWKMLGASHPLEANLLESRYLNWAFGMPDAREGIMAFLEKKTPRFPMRISTDMPGSYPWWKPENPGM